MSADQTGRLDYAAYTLDRALEPSIAVFQAIFAKDVTFQCRRIVNRSNGGLRCAVLFLDGMSDSRVINESILAPLTSARIEAVPLTLTALMHRVVAGNSVTESYDVAELAAGILAGDTVILMQGEAGGLIVNTRGFATRGISEPDDEKSLRGPREGFTEALMTNAAMLRRKLQTPDLKFVAKSFGSRSNTKAFLCYLESLADPSVLAELERRLETVDLDGALDVNYLQEYIKDSPRSLFKTCGSSEKPDVVAAKLLEGRIALILDGTPIVLTVPYLFVENLQSPDDYYTGFYFATFGRLLRFVGFFLSISAPAIYASLIAFHPEMIPTGLMLSIAAALARVPFPTVVECAGMLILFEILRETGIRMPNKFGQALGIVGALIVGQAAVEARIVSAPVVIVVALTGITGLMVPRMTGAVIALRFLLLGAAAVFGLYGYFLALLVLIFYLTSLESFGLEYTSQLFPDRPGRLADIYLRAPMPNQRHRPYGMARDEIRR